MKVMYVNPIDVANLADLKAAAANLGQSVTVSENVPPGQAFLSNTDGEFVAFGNDGA